jgi:hypothetical protein
MTVLTKKQVREYGWKEYTEGGRKYRIRATVRYDDQCGNGHNTFSITGDIDRKGTYGWEDDAGGCLHDEIAKHFPKLKPYIKWHLVSSDGPMHYLANTLYHASNRDHNGLLKGEKRQIRNGKTGLPCWKLTQSPADLPKQVDSETRPTATAIMTYEPWCREGEGKERELGYARGVAVWPEATDEELCAEPEVLKAALLARLPALMEAFRKDVESLGFVF